MKVEQTNWKKMDRQRPSYRIWRALRRLTRDKWISGPVLRDAACSLCSAKGWLFDQVIRGCPVEFYVGMFQGRPIAMPGDPEYSQALKALYDCKKPLGGVAPELFILNLEIQRRVRDGSRS